MPNRYDTIQSAYWPYTGLAINALSIDLSDLEAKVANLALSGGPVSWSAVQSKPTFATVATSGSYNDLTSKPTIPDTSTLAPKANPTFTGTVSGVTKAHVGLGNVDNTADTAKTFTGTQITSGTVPAARLGTGTPNSTTYLAGDGTWKGAPVSVQVVQHGTDANVARPAGVPLIIWEGSVKPNNAAGSDFWRVP